MGFYDGLVKYSLHTAIITEQSQKISYGHLLKVADSIGKHIKKRHLVFVICKNCFESIAGYIGLIRAGAVLVLINHSISNDFLSNLLKVYKPSYIYLPKDTVALNIGCISICSFGSYLLLKTDCVIDYLIHDDLAILLTTSGSTGSPKFVRQSYKNIDSNTEAITQYLGISPLDRSITTMPMSYTYSLSIINTHLAQGASIVLTESTLMDRSFWENMKNNKVTTFGGVPYIYEMLKKLRFERMNLPSLTYITQAGGRLSVELSHKFADACEKKSIKFYVMYGQTEATARMAYLPWKLARTKAGSIGIAIPGGHFWLENENGVVIEESEISGELVYQGDNVSLGYADSYLDLVKGDENQGVLHTGDIAKRDKDGFYYIVGRKKRFLKMFGSRVNLDEIEQIVTSDGYDCACVGVDDYLKIYVTDQADLKKIRNNIAKRIGINQAGIVVVYVNKIPRNESGKILYFELQKQG